MTFRWNEAGMAELDIVVGDFVETLADDISNRAQGYAPVDTGRYRDSIHVQRRDAESAVVADVPYAIYVEYGTADTPTFAPLTRASDETRLE